MSTLPVAAAVCGIIATASAMTLFYLLCMLASENLMGEEDTYTGYTISATILLFFVSGAGAVYYL